ncbi:alkaline phosphatase PhoX [Nonomuraea dietziae]|uniref:alkaline phosphatase PhoX n=1 Tax=Nonomuraea dietziae TaxID=65515 RepID=UPI003606EF2F
MQDLRDGQVRLHLPDGFGYRSFNPAGEAFTDGSPTPGRHDGMAAFRGPRGTTILVRNHEVNGPVGAFGDLSTAYDPAAGGGTATLQVTRDGRVLRSGPSLNGTQMNCSGGPMPWGSWVTCEETVNGPDVGNDFSGGDNTKLREKHGYIFEVPIDAAASARPIRSAGRFAHESAAFDPLSGAIYLTEDNFAFASGFYRYLPPSNPLKSGRIDDGGRLQMLAVRGAPNKDLSAGQPAGASYDVTWVDIDDPDPAFSGTPSNDVAIQAVGKQGRDQGAALFSRLEGAVHHHGVIYFVSTQGGATATGHPAVGVRQGPRAGVGVRDVEQAAAAGLRVAWLDGARPARQHHHQPEGRAGAVRGRRRRQLPARADQAGGEIFDFARLEPVAGDSGAEFAGSTFGPGGRTLYVNIQSGKGLSFAIWGPWHRGGF